MKIFSIYINKKSKLFQKISLLLILIILSYFLVFSKSNYEITSNVVDIFISIVLPSLFPFILFSNILIYSNCFTLIAYTRISKLLKRFFRTSQYGTSAIIFGFLFGYPNGARYVNELYQDKKIGFKEAEYLLLFINNSSPAFVLSSVGIGMFGNIEIGVLLLISHVVSAIIVGIIFRKKHHLKSDDINNENIHTINYNISFETVTKAITKTIYTMCMIFAFMVIFTLSYNFIIKMLEFIIKPNSRTKSFILSVFEISSGLNKLTNANIDLKILVTLTSFFLGFSSLSIIFQIFSCVYTNKFRLKNIIKGKLMHGIFSTIITYVLVNTNKIYEYICITHKANANIDSFQTIDKNTDMLLSSLIITVIHIVIFFMLIQNKKKRPNIVS